MSKPFEIAARRLWLGFGLAALLCAAASTAPAAGRTWVGPAGGHWFVATNWVPDDNWPQAGDSATITNGWVLLTNSTTNLASFAITNATLIFSNWDTCLAASNVAIWNRGTLTVANAFTTNQMSNRVWIVCSNLTIETGGQINVDAAGFAGDNGPGRGTGVSRGAGGGYGGVGGKSEDGTPGLPYGSANAPTAPGSGGGSAPGYPAWGKPGGGAVRIEAGGSVTNNGLITANGDTATYVQGAGSGGAVYISCRTLAGNGIICCNGGSNISSYTCGGGGGGRIAINYHPAAQADVTPAPSVRLLALPGTDLAAIEFPDIGTIWMPDSTLLGQSSQYVLGAIEGFSSWSPASLTISNNWLRFAEDGFKLVVAGPVMVGGASGQLDLGGNAVDLNYGIGTAAAEGPSLSCGALLLTNQGCLYVYNAATNVAHAVGATVSVSGTLAIATNCWIYSFSNPTNGGSAQFAAGAVRIATGGGFKADAGGYFPGSSAGLGAGGGFFVGARAGGAGYGGRGGDGSGGISGGNPFGSTNAPADCGSSGASYAALRGGVGGGLLRIAIAGALTLDGTISANGGKAGNGGGGSGGGIFIVCAALEGNGILCAAGGNSSSSTYHGGGGGGRIAVWVDVPPNIRTRYVGSEGRDGRAVARATNWPDFGGTPSVIGGLGYYNPPTNGCALPGTCFFFKPVKGAQFRAH